MAVQQDGIDITLPAAGDLSANQYYPLVVEADGQVNTGVGNGTQFVGILQNKPAAADRGAVVRIVGSSKVVGDAGLNERDALTANAQGFATATSTDNQFVVGDVIVATAGSAEVAQCIVNCRRY